MLLCILFLFENYRLAFLSSIDCLSFSLKKLCLFEIKLHSFIPSNKSLFITIRLSMIGSLLISFFCYRHYRIQNFDQFINIKLKNIRTLIADSLCNQGKILACHFVSELRVRSPSHWALGIWEHSYTLHLRIILSKDCVSKDSSPLYFPFKTSLKKILLITICTSGDNIGLY